jgi:hypothetical protein
MIGFCFLTYDNIIRYDIWNKFFENIDQTKYCVMIHNKYNKYDYSLYYTFQYKIIKKKIITKNKEDISIVKATLKLFEETLENYNDITHIVFLTQSCIPLYNFNTLYNIITKISLSMISLIKYNKKERYYQLDNRIKKNIYFNNFVKQQPNMILIKNDVKLLINNDLTNYFYKMECPDEHYFINIFLNIFKINFIKKQINFCNTDFNKTQALEFNLVNNIFINKIRSYGFLFMRKVNNNSNIDIDYLLN